MEPVLSQGDLLLVRYGRPVKVGQIVVARFVDGTLVVKRVARACPTRRGDPGWWLLSDDPSVGIDSRHRGPVPADDVAGVVVARLWPRSSRRLSAGPFYGRRAE